MPLNSFLTRLILWCVSPLALFAAYLGFDYVFHEHEEHDAEAQRLTKTLATLVDNDLASRIAALRILAASPLADDVSRWPDLYREAQGFRQSFGGHVLLLDLDRRIRFNTRVPLGTVMEPPRLPPPKGQSAVQTVLQTANPAVSDILRDPFGTQQLIAVAVPGLREGKPAFVMASSIPIGEFQHHVDKVASNDLAKGWSIELRDGTGETIVRTPQRPARDGAADEAPRRFMSVSTLSPWSVVLEIPRAVYLAPVLEATVNLAIAILGVTLAGILGGTLAARRLGSAVRSLAQPPAPKAPPPDIAEIAAVRRLLDTSIESRNQAEAALLTSHAELQRLFAAQDRVQENERRRIALELHDDLQQTLAAISINVAALRERASGANGGANADAGALPVLDDINGLAASAMDSTRRIVSALRPQILEDLGLLPALETLASQFRLRNGIDCEVQGNGNLDARLLAAPALTTSLYRVAQEGLTNVAKHAKASRVQIHLGLAEPGRLRLSIADDGQGMAPPDRQKPGSFGLAGIEERVRALGGEVQIQSSPGAGTRIEVTVPLPEAGAARPA